MKLIVGLGNPGKDYEKTRHNAGFLAIDHFLSDKHAINCSSKFEGHVCEMHFAAARHEKGPIKVFFMKPQTYMNNSGHAVLSVCKFYKLKPETDLLVVHDEMDLKFGELRPAFNSRAAGHNGVQDIVDQLDSQKFARIRIGVDARESKSQFPTEKYVLSAFSPEEIKHLTEKTFPDADKLMRDFIEQ